MLTKTTLVALLDIASEAFGHMARAVQNEIDPANPQASSGEAPAPKRRGRPAASATAPVAPATETTTNVVEKNTTASTESASALINKAKDGKTLDELKALIQPLIKAARGTEVKAVINKYKPEGHDGDYTLSLLSEQPQHHAAFVADIETLSM